MGKKSKLQAKYWFLGIFLLPLEDTGIEKTKIHIHPMVNYPSSKNLYINNFTCRQIKTVSLAALNPRNLDP
jgi:hypothetical protein